MTAPTNLAPDQVRQDYIARCYKMSHAELFAELMHVHQAAGQLMDKQVKRTVESERSNIVKLIEDYVKDMDSNYKELGNEIAGTIQARGGNDRP